MTDCFKNKWYLHWHKREKRFIKTHVGELSSLFFHCIWHCLRDCYILCLFLETIVLLKPALQLEEGNNAFKQNFNLQKQDTACFCYSTGLSHEKSLKNKFDFGRERKKKKHHKENHRLLQGTQTENLWTFYQECNDIYKCDLQHLMLILILSFEVLKK